MVNHLDLIDRKILYKLSQNARVSYSDIAKFVNLSKKSVINRIEQFEKKEIIQGYYPVIDFFKLGYMYCRIFAALQNISLEEKEQLKKDLTNDKDIFWLFSMHGNYDLGIAITAKNLTHFKRIVSSIEDKYGKYIKYKFQSVLTELETLSYRFDESLPPTKSLVMSESSFTQRIKLDDLDYKILNVLCKNGRESLVNIGFEVGASAKVVMYRIKNLEKKNLILGYKPIVDFKKIGIGYYKLLLDLSLTKETSKEQIKKYLRSTMETFYIVEEIGSNRDLDIEVLCSSLENLYKFVEDLRFQFPKSINNYELIIFEETLKVNYLP